MYKVSKFLARWSTTSMKHRSAGVSTVCCCRCCSNCCVNPIVYCFINDSFQRNAWRTLRCRCTATYAAARAAVGGRALGAGGSGSGKRAGRRGGTGSAGDAVDVELRVVNGGTGTGAVGGSTGSTSLKTDELRSTFVWRRRNCNTPFTRWSKLRAHVAHVYLSVPLVGL